MYGDEGISYDRDTGESGYVRWNTILRLRDYKLHGEVKPLVREKKFAEEHTETVGGVTFQHNYIKRLCITDFGRQYGSPATSLMVELGVRVLPTNDESIANPSRICHKSSWGESVPQLDPAASLQETCPCV